MKRLLFLLATAGAAASANAHQIWLEQPDGGSAVIRFGEFGDNLRAPTATLVAAKGERNVQATKSANGFTLPFKAPQGDTIVAEDAAFPLRRYKQGEKEVTSWYHPAARYASAFDALKPSLALDIVPAGKPGEFKVFFKGQPLHKAKVAIVVQSDWTKEARSDEQGTVSFDMPWKGSYVLETAHIDRTPGERAGAKGLETASTMSPRCTS